jgi:cell wall-associated NlpC family hydrolase
VNGAIPDWAAPYIGLPYVDKGRTREGVDCWGLVRLVLADVFHVNLPDYSGAYRDGDDWGGIAHAVRAGLAEGPWVKTQQPRAGDLLILKIADRPWHCGVMLSSTRFLHAKPGDSVVHEPLDTPRWSNRIEGIYRHG